MTFQNFKRIYLPKICVLIILVISTLGIDRFRIMRADQAVIQVNTPKVNRYFHQHYKHIAHVTIPSIIHNHSHLNSNSKMLIRVQFNSHHVSYTTGVKTPNGLAINPLNN